MFGNKNEKQSNNQSSVSASNASNSIVEGTHIKGDISANNDIRIDGTLIGKLDCSGRVVIGTQGKIEGQINCVNAIIEGTFIGTIKVAEFLVLKETAVLEGDIATEKLMIHPEARFNGQCTMGGQKLKALTNQE